MQGMVQGALGGCKALAQGIGPIVDAGIFAIFTRKHGRLPYLPGKVLLLRCCRSLAAQRVLISCPVGLCVQTS